MNSAFFVSNRERLATMTQGGIIILRANNKVQSSNDNTYRFKQEANFYYVSGILEAEWTLVIDGTSHSSFLIAPDIDETHRIFNGSLSDESAKRISGVDRVYDQTEGLRAIRRLAKRHSVVHTIDLPPYAAHYDFQLNSAIGDNKKMLERTFARVQDCSKDLRQLRAIKQPEEIAAIKQAIKHTANAFETIHSQLPKYSYEYNIEADFTHAFRSAGLAGHAYDPIVASGQNACTLHYIANDTKLHSRQLVLLDIGAEYDNYAADISRTYSKGEPTKRQRAVHEAVERAHHEIIDLLEPELSVEHYQNQVLAIMERELISLGLMHAGDEAKLRRYFPHAISHGLGLDVHDSLGAPRAFQPQMVLTVEPGIYIPEEGIGVRIEDDILITERAHVNLSASLSTGL